MDHFVYIKLVEQGIAILPDDKLSVRAIKERSTLESNIPLTQKR